jgi:helicase SWR1
LDEGGVGANAPIEDGAGVGPLPDGNVGGGEEEPELEPEEPEEEGGSIADYMIAFVQRDPEFFRDWKL